MLCASTDVLGESVGDAGGDKEAVVSIVPATTPAPEPRRRRVLALPSTRLGWWTVGLAVGVIALLALDGALAGAGVTDWGWGARLALGLSSAAGIATAISAGVLAVTAVVKGERSLVLLGPLLFGAFWVMFVLGEFLSPH